MTLAGFRFWFFAVLALGVAGTVLQHVATPVWPETRIAAPVLSVSSNVGAARQGAVLALLGGFRGLAADALWLRLYASWERQDGPAAEALIALVSAVDPRPEYFWINGARILAYDVTAWRIAASGGYDAVPATRQREITREQAERALAHLALAQQHHPTSAALWLERAAIEQNQLHDLLAAAESYRRAWEQPNAPYYAARLHAELLRRAGHKAEALAWLVRLHPTLPANDESAAADVVLSRIRDLERELDVPSAQAYRVTR